MRHTLPFCLLHLSHAPLLLVSLYALLSSKVIFLLVLGCIERPSWALHTNCCGFTARALGLDCRISKVVLYPSTTDSLISGDVEGPWGETDILSEALLSSDSMSTTIPGLFRWDSSTGGDLELHIRVLLSIGVPYCIRWSSSLRKSIAAWCFRSLSVLQAG